MFLTSLFLAAFARSLASPTPIIVPSSPIPSPLCVVAATLTASQCDPTRTRTTFDILYSCIGVILLCTYISIHHNIPAQEHSRAKVTCLKLRTTLYALLAPEMMIMWAIRQRIMAGRIARANKHRGWTKVHGFFVQMGGLMQQVVVEEEVTYRVAGVTTQRDRHVDWDSMKIPRIPEKEIKDHGKGDLLSKALVVVQTTWFVAQCIARNIQGLVLTEIELVTLAFAMLNVITYILWWDKPLDIQYPIYFDENGARVDGPQTIVDRREGAWHKRIRRSIEGHTAGLTEVFQNIWDSVKTYRQDWNNSLRRQGVVKTIWKKVVKTPFLAIFGPLWDMMDEEGEGNGQTRVDPFYAAYMEDRDRHLVIVYGSLVGVIFGGIHLIAWDFQFPTFTELWLWRAASLILTITPLFLAVGYALPVAQVRLNAPILEIIGVAFLLPTAFLGAPLYFVARVVLLFIAFSTLRAPPDTAYQNIRWTELLPHV